MDGLTDRPVRESASPLTGESRFARQRLGLLQKADLEHQTLDLVRTAFDVFRVPVDQADVADDGTLLEGNGRTLHLQILDHHDRVAVIEHVPVNVPRHGGVLRAIRLLLRPLVRAVGTDVQIPIGIDVLHAAMRARGGS